MEQPSGSLSPCQQRKRRRRRRRRRFVWVVTVTVTVIVIVIVIRTALISRSTSSRSLECLGLCRSLGFVLGLALNACVR